MMQKAFSFQYGRLSFIHKKSSVWHRLCKIVQKAFQYGRLSFIHKKASVWHKLCKRPFNTVVFRLSTKKQACGTNCAKGLSVRSSFVYPQKKQVCGTDCAQGLFQKGRPSFIHKKATASPLSTSTANVYLFMKRNRSRRKRPGFWYNYETVFLHPAPLKNKTAQSFKIKGVYRQRFERTELGAVPVLCCRLLHNI